MERKYKVRITGLGRQHKHWCPNGCGKKLEVSSERFPHDGKNNKVFICETCNQKFISINCVKNKVPKHFLNIKIIIKEKKK